MVMFTRIKKISCCAIGDFNGDVTTGTFGRKVGRKKTETEEKTMQIS